jgi:hypothetical protein
MAFDDEAQARDCQRCQAGECQLANVAEAEKQAQDDQSGDSKLVSTIPSPL